MRFRSETIILLLVVAVIILLAVASHRESPASEDPDGTGAQQLPDAPRRIQRSLQHPAGAELSGAAPGTALYVVAGARPAHRVRSVSDTG